MEALGILIGIACLAGGIALLRYSWSLNGRSKLPAIAGWLSILGGFVAFGRALGGETGATYACLLLSLIAFCAVAFGVEVRSASHRRPREAAPEPEDRAASWLRGTAKALISIVLAGVAAIGIGLVFAIQMPMPPVDRIIIGGILVPVLWGGGMAWTLCDAKLLRASILLTTVSAISYGLAFLPKVLS